MATLYHVLGLTKSASEAEIKSAFKALALKYHPDRNPDNPAAEEKFKEINRAYQVLSDSYKKYQYDLSFEVRKPTPPPRSTYEPFYYPPFAQKPRYRKREYQFGWKYVKSQVVAFAFIFIVAALVMGVKYLYDEYKIAEEQRLTIARLEMFKVAQGHFDRKEYRASLDIILEMYRKNPGESSISNYHDKFLTSLMHEADAQFTQNNFESAIFNFKVVSDYQIIDRPEVYKKLAQSYKALDMFEETVAVLSHLQERDENSLKLNMEIGLIYHKKLHQPENAKPYLDRARGRVKEIITEIYGRAAELVMKPSESPPIYFNVFLAHARLYSELGLNETAIKDCNWTVFLRPDLPEPYYLRANNYLAMGNDYKACKNWKESASRNHEASIAMVSQYCN